VKNLIYTIAYRRTPFLRLSMAAVLSQAYDSDYVIWDNASSEETKDSINKMAEAIPNPHVKIHYVASKNIGLNAASMVVSKFRTSSTKYIMSLDEDILMLPLNFQDELQTYVDAGVGYVALDVFQDETTNGAKPPIHHYKHTDLTTTRGVKTLLEGPTGGWASMVSTEVFDSVGGYPVREEIFFGLDGIFSEEVRKKGKMTGIAKGLCCYHATGNNWNNSLGFSDVLNQKLQSYNRWVKSGSP
jgi:GT2 family glycosyltransferase